MRNRNGTNSSYTTPLAEEVHESDSETELEDITGAEHSLLNNHRIKAHREREHRGYIMTPMGKARAYWLGIIVCIGGFLCGLPLIRILLANNIGTILTSLCSRIRQRHHWRRPNPLILRNRLPLHQRRRDPCRLPRRRPPTTRCLRCLLRHMAHHAQARPQICDHDLLVYLHYWSNDSDDQYTQHISLLRGKGDCRIRVGRQQCGRPDV